MTKQLIQYVVLRSDLGWTTGALIAQACHCSVAAITKGLKENDAETLEYVEDLNNMRKVVLKAQSAQELQDLETKLKDSNLPHHLWIEQPENIPCCLVTYPRDKQTISDNFRNLKLLR